MASPQSKAPVADNKSLTLLEQKRNELMRLKTEYLSARTNQLFSQGMDPTLAYQKAEKEYQDQFVSPITNEFAEKGIEDKNPEKGVVTSFIGIPGIDPKPLPAREIEPIGVPSTAELIKGAVGPKRTVGIAGKDLVQSQTNFYSDPDWNQIKSQVKDDVEVEALKAAYQVKKSAPQNVDRNPALILEETITELQALPDVLSGKGDMIKGEVSRGLNDPLYQTFVLQKREGSIPDLTDVQMAYLDKQIKMNREQIISDKRKELKGKTKNVLVLKSGRQIEAVDYEPKVDGPVAKTMVVPITEEDIVSKSVGAANLKQPEIWWTDPKKRPEVLADPKKFNKSSFFETTTPFGETQETAQAWILRSALTIPNALTGAIAAAVPSPAALMKDVTTEDVEQYKKEARKKDQPVFEDHPVLYNVANNLSFTGEAQQTAKELESRGLMTPMGATLYTGAGFVADLFDPTFGIIGGATKAGKTGVTVAKASKALTGETAIAKAAKTAAKAGLAEAIDITVPVFGSKIAEKVSPGDIRILLSSDLSNSIAARRYVIDEMNKGVDAAEAVKDKFGDTSYVKQAVKDITIEDPTARAAALRNLEDTPLGKAMNRVDEYADGVRAIVNDNAVTFSKDFRSRDLARDISAVAAVNPRVKAVLSDLYIGSNKVELRDMVKALDSQGLMDQVVGHHIFSTSLSTVAKETKNVKDLGNLVQVTPNTWASKKDISKVMGAISSTSVGKLAADIKAGIADGSIKVMTGTGSRGINQYYDFSKAPRIADRVQDVKNEMKGYGRVSKASILDREFSTVSRQPSTRVSMMSTTEFRNLINAQIDAMAEGKQVAFRASDVKELSYGRQRDMLEPMENRSLGQSTVKDVINSAIPDKVNISIAQRQAFSRARNEMNAMDIKLKKDIARFDKDPELRKLLGAPATGEISLEDKIGYLTVGKNINETSRKKILSPIGGKFAYVARSTDLADTLKWSINRYVSRVKVSESLMDTLLGVKVDISDKYLSDLGRQELNRRAYDTVFKMRNNPSDYKVLWENFHNEWKNTIMDPNHVELLAAGTKPDNLLFIGEGKLPSELYVAGYYKQESSRVIRRAIADILDGDISLESNILPLTEKFRSLKGKIANIERGFQSPIDEDHWKSIIRNQAIQYVRNAPLDMDNLVRELFNPLEGQALTEVMDAVKNKNLTSPAIAEHGFSNYDEMKTFVHNLYDYAADVDDTSRSIVKRNGFKDNPTNAAHDIQEIYSIFQPEVRLGMDPTLHDDSEILLSAMFGQDAYQEVKNLMTSNKMEHIEKWFLEQAKLSIKGQNATKLYENASRFLRGVQELRYSLLLGIRPRFHGVNIMTAPIIAYSTIGQNPMKTIGIGLKDINALTTGEILKAQAMGSDSAAWNKIAVTDKAGRTYTNGEIWEAVVSGGGVRSAGSFNISQAMIDNTLKLVPKGTADVVAKALLEKPASFANYMDNYFRLNTAVAALKEGRSLEEATSLARRSLFDYADMTPQERWLSSRVAIFYAFKRQNFKQLLVNMASPKGWSRITTILRTENGLEKLLGEEPDNPAYLPDYINFRKNFKIERREEFEKKDVLFLGPSVPTNEAILSLANLMSGKLTDEVKATLTPEIQTVLGIKKFQEQTNQLQPLHAWFYQQAPSLFNEVFGDVEYKEGLDGSEGAINGKIYPLTSEQEATYKKLVELSNFMGISTFLKDWGKLGLNTDDLPIGERLGQGVGIYTTAKVNPPEDSEKNQILTRMDEIRKRIKELEESEQSKNRNR